jgi:predicted transcriptional regulator
MLSQEEIDRIIATREENVEIAQGLKDKGLNNAAIARWMGVRESAVRLLLKET